MSTPILEVDVGLFSEAHAEEPPVDVSVEFMQPRPEPLSVQAFTAAEPARQITVGVVPVWGVAVGWVLAIVLVAQAVKYTAKAFGLKELLGTSRWKRWMYVAPIGVGVLLSGLFGPQLGELFGMRFGIWASVLILGPGSGAAAAFAYDVLRAVVLPVLPAVVVGAIERVTGLQLPESAKEIELSEDSDSEVLP